MNNVLVWFTISVWALNGVLDLGVRIYKLVHWRRDRRPNIVRFEVRE